MLYKCVGSFIHIKVKEQFDRKVAEKNKSKRKERKLETLNVITPLGNSPPNAVKTISSKNELKNNIIT
jgi:hypothetical protein